MAQRNRTTSSGAELSSRRESLRGGKREREGNADLPETGSKRSRMAEAGSTRVEGSQAPWLWKDSEEEPEVQQSQEEPLVEVCPITNKHEKPFRLMDMPPEVRIEIYRACLTRPFDVLLSKEPKPIERSEKQILEEDHEGFVDGRASQESDDGAPLDHGSDNVEFMAPNTLQGGAASSGARSARGMRALRSFTRSTAQRILSDQANAANDRHEDGNSLQIPATTNTASHGIGIIHTNTPSRGRRTIATTGANVAPTISRAPRAQDADPLLVNLLRASKLVYKESRAILYGENTFLLDLDTAQPTLAALHQRSRGQIKNLRVTIPTHNEILERFAEVVRLSLRYCKRLQRFAIHMPFILPGAEGSSTSGNTTVYANAFDILRWLPQQCNVVLEGNVCEEIRKVVEKNLDLAKSLDELAYARRQLISNDAQRLPVTR